MLFLGIDTSSAMGTLALTLPGKVLAEWNLDVDRTHAKRLLPHLRWMLEEAGLRLADVEGFAVTLGPGSFTGLRMGITTAKTLALVSGKPLGGGPTLDVLAGNLPETVCLICPVLDARRGEVYSALYRGDGSGNTERLTEYRVLSPETLLQAVPGPVLFLGSGVGVYGDRFRSAGIHRVALEPEQNHLRASVLCRLAREIHAAAGATRPRDLRAIYVRPSDAERKKDPAHAS
jgi:tRNA threonylcarbamoyladenosine biosynthesis protein TsaB